VVSGKLAESQFIGGMIMGMGQALLEAVRIDPRKWPDPQQQPRYAVRA
jgi:CO/xanthine dehydrogenase Mo-binding subunit